MDRLKRWVALTSLLCAIASASASSNIAGTRLAHSAPLLAKRQNGCITPGQASSICRNDGVCAYAPLDKGWTCCPPGHGYYCYRRSTDPSGICSRDPCPPDTCTQGQTSNLCYIGTVCAVVPADNGFYCCAGQKPWYCGATSGSQNGTCQDTPCSPASTPPPPPPPAPPPPPTSPSQTSLAGGATPSPAPTEVASSPSPTPPVIAGQTSPTTPALPNPPPSSSSRTTSLPTPPASAPPSVLASAPPGGPSTSPTPNSLTSNTLPAPPPSSSSGPLIGGIAGGIAAAVLLGAVGTILYTRHRARSRGGPRTGSLIKPYRPVSMYTNLSSQPQPTPPPSVTPPTQVATFPMYPQPAFIQWVGDGGTLVAMATAPGPGSVANSMTASLHPISTTTPITSSSTFSPTSSETPAHWLYLDIVAKKGHLLNAGTVPYEGPDTTVVEKHAPSLDDEIALFPGHMVRIKNVFRDGWSVGWNLDTGSFGMFPLTAIDLSHSANAASSRIYVNSRGVSRVIGRPMVMEERERLRESGSVVVGGATVR
ncbi:hypothetical protein M427DRAFT_137038 [Gonapodya prolifera JEL478]|uniref:SH3 domain-containing protein n=1 Tax=Gonapodya prolifera (strain JEL478) TaxID=1344416 RepID=A0A139A7N1_GONPJ|nr:hypothetical protein M427DRAFT_137038 [Gonapodya prolifera JEL478]|eukprot:KXS12704.1 hypothetical protein M427DRAFT_137038 [Gonapodya prolifera JEL478]